MTPLFKKMHGGTIVMSFIAAVVILVTAWQTKGTPNQNTWWYELFVWAILFGAIEAYYSYTDKKDKNK